MILRLPLKREWNFLCSHTGRDSPPVTQCLIEEQSSTFCSSKMTRIWDGTKLIILILCWAIRRIKYAVSWCPPGRAMMIGQQESETYRRSQQMSITSCKVVDFFPPERMTVNCAMWKHYPFWRSGRPGCIENKSKVFACHFLAGKHCFNLTWIRVTFLI